MTRSAASPSPRSPLRATFLVPYPVGRAPGQRFRFEQWLDLLPPGAVEAQVVPLFDERMYARLYERGALAWKVTRTVGAFAKRVRDVVRSRRADVVFLYREAFPLGPPVMEALLERRVPVVFDFDDAIYLGDTSPANSIVRWLKRPEKVGRVVAGSATTTVGNRHLADYARRFAPHVEVIPTTLDIERYRPRPRPRQKDGLVRVGWSGSPTTSPHLQAISPVLRRMLLELPVELTVIGDPGFHLEGVEGVTVRPWSAETEIDDVGAFDIGLMPLPDDEWTRGKCGFKALLYMALGVPTVASPVGVNTEIIEHGANGLLASTDDDWFDALARLVEDPELREELGSAGRVTVVERYSGQRWAPRFLEVLEEAASRPC